MQTRRRSFINFALAGVLFLPISTASASPLLKPSQKPGGQTGSAKDGADLRELAQEMPLERQLAGGGSHSYRIKIASGQHLYLLVSQRGVDVLLRIVGPDDRVLAEVNDQHNSREVELFSLLAESTGTYKLEVQSAETAVTGLYEISMEVIDAWAPEGKKRIAAERAYAEAERLRQQGKGETDSRANEKYQQALLLWREIGDRLREAKTLYSIGVVTLRLNNGKKALEYFLQSLPIYRAIGYQRGEASAFSGLGASYASLGQMTKAIESSEQSLQMFSRLSDPSMEARLLSNIGGIYAAIGELEKSLEYLKQGLEILRKQGDPLQEALVHNALGVTYERLGEHQKALEHYERALPLFRGAGDAIGEATPLNNIGEIYRLLGEPRKGLEYYHQAHDVLRAAGYSTNDAIILTNIGRTHEILEDHQKALDYLDQALRISRATQDRYSEGIVVDKIGWVYENSGAPLKALEYYSQAVLLFRSMEDHQREADTIRSIGDVNWSLGNAEKALEYYGQALPVQRAMGDRKAEAATLFGLARVERDRGNLVEARTHIEEALNIIESLRGKVDGQELRASYLASKQDYYELDIDLLMRMHKRNPSGGFDTLALKANERARARGLLELLNEARVSIREGVDPLLLERERSLQQRINGKAERLTRLLSGKYKEEETETARKELDSIVTEYQDVQAHIRKNSPRYASLTQPQPIGLKEIQQRVVDGDTLLLEYSLGKERSYLWAVSPTSITSYQLPGRAEIETASRRVYDLLIAGDKRETRTQAKMAAAELSRIVLGPVAGLLENKRLLIVSDGALQYVPFAALPAPQLATVKRKVANDQHRDMGGYRALVVDHEIVSLPSVSAFALLRQEIAGRKPASKAVAVLADPVLQIDDPRVKEAIAKVARPAGESAPSSRGERRAKEEMTRSARESGIVFDRLRYTRQEAEAIAALAPREGTFKGLDFDASRDRAMSADLGEYRIVHFATHGLINSQHPELSGVVLSLVDRQGNTQDGFLRLHDIYNMKLQAEMVVLSACQTALGKEIRGEGLMGLTRGFTYAGAARVVASLWDVKDEATSELMKRFYRGMFEGGLRPAAALRAAQIEMLKEPRWESPYYWAAFVIQGEWK